MNLIDSLSLASTVEALRSGRLDLVDHVEAVCDRVDTVDPIVNALLPEADRRGRLLREAGTLVARSPEPDNRPLVYGAIVGVKDLFRVDGLPTTAGSLLPPRLFVGPEASVVTSLRNAGALILGKTHTDEFAYSE